MGATVLVGATERWAVRPAVEVVGLIVVATTLTGLALVTGGRWVWVDTRLPDSRSALALDLAALLLYLGAALLVVRVAVWSVSLARLRLVDTGDRLELRWGPFGLRSVPWDSTMMLRCQVGSRRPELSPRPSLLDVETKDRSGRPSFRAELLVDLESSSAPVERLRALCLERGLDFWTG